MMHDNTNNNLISRFAGANSLNYICKQWDLMAKATCTVTEIFNAIYERKRI